jgi:alpha-methylacyl-CoA racemase
MRIIEVAAIGPAPFCAMMLSDMGATVLRIERPADRNPTGRDPKFDFLLRGRRSIKLDLKSDLGREAALDLVRGADGLIEGFRPRAMERLRLGPADCHAVNRRLVYGRMTGWGQEGPLSQMAGHDLNYIGLTGVLHCIGRQGERPVPPLNLLGDFGGGGMLLAFGMVCALLESARSREGKVVDASILDGTLALAAYLYGLHAGGYWSDQRGTNHVDGGAPWYDVYETLDSKYVAVAAIEPQFYAAFLCGLGVDAAQLPAQHDKSQWFALRSLFASRLASKTREDWVEHFAALDACVSPVLTLEEAPGHPHIMARRSFGKVSGLRQPSPAPRFSRTQAETLGSGEKSISETLEEWGLDDVQRRRIESIQTD